MIELAVIGLRGVQYLLVSLTFGLPAFVVLNRVHLDDAALVGLRDLVGWGTAGLFLCAPLAIVAQTALMAGSLPAALDTQVLLMVVTGMGLGAALAVRWAAAAAGGLLFLLRPGGRGFWFPALLAGFVAILTFAWTGHGGATEGAAHLPHLASTALHAIAAAFWIGALVAFLRLAFRAVASGSVEEAATAAMLSRFAGVGSITVAVLVATGLINVAVLVGPSRLAALPQSAYGALLLAKMGLFAVMLGLAALHRFRLAPLMTARSKGALGHLRYSLAAEFACGSLILALVAALGVLPPPASM